jgi:lycopene cyclase domain-containing protein
VIPQRLEYLTLLVFLFSLLLALYGRQLARLLRSAPFWTGFAAFFFLAIAIESLALGLGWWTFNRAKMVGLYAAGIPLEEYALFLGFYAMVTAHWELLLELD